jgi:hypothetical protein
MYHTRVNSKGEKSETMKLYDSKITKILDNALKNLTAKYVM